MTSSHIRAIDRLVAAFNSRDLERFMADSADDFKIESRFSSVAGTIFRGREGVTAWWRDLAEAWNWMEIEYEKSGDVTADRTVILFVLRGMGKSSAMRLDEPIGQRWQWRGELLEKIDYLDRREAEMIVMAANRD